MKVENKTIKSQAEFDFFLEGTYIDKPSKDNSPICLGEFNCPAYEATDCPWFFDCSTINRGKNENKRINQRQKGD